MNRHRHPLPQLIPNRLRGHLARLKEEIWSELGDLDAAVSLRGDASAEDAPRLSYGPVLQKGTVFAAASWEGCWFRVDAEGLRERGAGEDRTLYLEWKVNGESVLYSGTRPWCGYDTAHLRAPLPPLEGDPFLYLRCAAYQTGKWMRPGEESLPPVEEGRLVFHHARLLRRNEGAWKAYHAMALLFEVMEKELSRWRGDAPEIGFQPPLVSCPPLLRKLLYECDCAVDLYDRGERRAYEAQIEEIYRRFPAAPWEDRVALIGNSHIDLVWLWPEKASEEKTLHTAATALRLMERYPDFRFSFTQPEMLDRLKTLSPALYDEIRGRMETGQWEMLGAMEVEGDTLLPSGEGILRNLLLGQRRFKALTGRPSEILWLPDAFGFAACLPQLARQAGVKYFFTTKLAWSALNRFPYGSFIWSSPDGSSLISHLARVGYTARAEVDEVQQVSRLYPQADIHDESLLAVGFGDGGGGVTEEQCERASRLASLASLPRCAWSRADAFFRRLERLEEKLPHHRGELYLEYHRGTYTTMSRMKELYRRTERLLQTLEALAAAKAVPVDTDRNWSRLIFFQFHDALPGSSIREVYRRIFRELEEMIPALEGRIRGLAEGELQPVRGGAAALPPGTGRREIWNPLAVPRTLFLEGRGTVALPPLGSIRLADASFEGGERVAAFPRELSNGLLTARFDGTGALAELSSEGRTFSFSPGAGFRLFQDKPGNFEAWDIDHSALWLEEPIPPFGELAVDESRPGQAFLRGELSFGRSSSLRVEYSLAASSRVLNVKVRVDWQEEGALLRYALPFGSEDLRPLCGAPFNAVSREPFSGKPGDEGLWEVPASRWIALQDPFGGGLGIVAKDRYGFSIREGEASLTLLRSPRSADAIAPSPETHYLDKGTHTIDFALTFHRPAGEASLPGTAQLAETLYAPVILTDGGPETPFGFTDLGSLTVSWVKPAFEGGGMVIRLHETAGASGRALLRRRGRGGAFLSNITEEERTPLRESSPGCFTLPYGAHQILTVILGDPADPPPAPEAAAPIA